MHRLPIATVNARDFKWVLKLQSKVLMANTVIPLKRWLTTLKPTIINTNGFYFFLVLDISLSFRPCNHSWTSTNLNKIKLIFFSLVVPKGWSVAYTSKAHVTLEGR